MNLPEWILVVSGLLALAVVLGILARKVRLPLTVVLAAVGFLGGWIGRWLGIGSPLGAEEFPHVMAFLFLPLLVFEAALGLSTRGFLRNLGPILALAVPALISSAAIVGLALYLLLGIPLPAALLFGVLISATDPVAVVAAFRELGVPGRLLTLVEGESLLNDGVAIVLFNILLATALGAAINVGEGAFDFGSVFFGGIGIGLVLGIVASLLLPWLTRLPATALTLAVAYGGYALAEHALGFSGVTATVAAGLVLGGVAPSRAAAPVRELWHEFWRALGYVANGLLFLFIGLEIDAQLLVDYVGPIALALLAVLVARPVAVVPVVVALERFAGVPSMGGGSLAVLVWGGLRGGVALALALSLPDTLPQRELFVAMAGGVVLGTLVVNATTIGPLVHRLGLDELSRSERFLAESARITGVAAARVQLRVLGLEQPSVVRALERVEAEAIRSLGEIHLEPQEEVDVVIRRGLFIERETYQHLTDARLLPPPAARTLLDEVDDEIERLEMDGRPAGAEKRRRTPVSDRLLELLTVRLPEPLGEDPTELAYAEASARRLAARRTRDELGLFERLPNVSTAAVEEARKTFRRWEERADRALAELDERAVKDHNGLQERQAQQLSRIAAEDALEELFEAGLLPDRAVRLAERAIAREVLK